MGTRLHTAAALIAAPCFFTTLAASEQDNRLYLFADVLSDDNDIELESDLGDSSIEDEGEWDDTLRMGVGSMHQYLLADEGGLLLSYGGEFSYTQYEAEGDSDNLEGELYMISPRVGIGMHASEWLFIEATAFAGIGLSSFTYNNEFGDYDEDSTGDLATEYGLNGTASFALGERVLLGVRAGWMQQNLEGTFEAENADADFESTTDGFFYGAFVGFRY